MIYFDYAATTPLDREAADVYVKVATEFYGNPSSLHDIGGQASSLLDNCRTELAQLLGIEKQNLFFTSGGSEGNFLAIEALLSSVKKKGNHIISGMAEHSSVHMVLKRLEKDGYEITLLPMESSGLIDLEKLSAAIRPETVLMVMQHVNSEIGTIQPLEKIGQVCRENNILLHTDAVQSFGKIDLKTIVPFVDSFSFSGHKIYGPKGIGGVYISPRLKWEPFLPGASQESGFRPGTHNVPAIVAMTVAAQKITSRLNDDRRKYSDLRKIFFETIEPVKDEIVAFEGPGGFQLPNIIGLRIKGMEGQWTMLECNRMGFAISTGSACQVGMQAPAKVTQALSLNHQEAKEFIRISFGNLSSADDVTKLGQHIIKISKEFTKR